MVSCSHRKIITHPLSCTATCNFTLAMSFHQLSEISISVLVASTDVLKTSCCSKLSRFSPSLINRSRDTVKRAFTMTICRCNNVFLRSHWRCISLFSSKMFLQSTGSVTSSVGWLNPIYLVLLDMSIFIRVPCDRSPLFVTFTVTFTSEVTPNIISCGFNVDSIRRSGWHVPLQPDEK